MEFDRGIFSAVILPQLIQEVLLSFESKSVCVEYRLIAESKLAHQKCTVKPVLSSRLKVDKTKVLIQNGSLMKVGSIAECCPLEHSAILLTCIKR